MYINTYHSINNINRPSFCSVRPKVQISRVNTSAEVDQIILKLKRGLKSQIGFKDITEPINAGIISSQAQMLLKEVDDLFMDVNINFSVLAGSAYNTLRKEYPRLSKIKQDESITLRNLNKSNIITFIKPLFGNDALKNVRYIVVRDVEKNDTRVVAFQDDKILRMKDYNSRKQIKPSNLVIADEFLSQEEINKIDIVPVLTELRKDLKNILELMTTGGGVISSLLDENINKIEVDLSTIRKKLTTKKIKMPNVILKPDGSIEFQEINNNREKLKWLPRDKNYKSKGSTVIKHLAEDGRIIDAIAINEGRIISNFPFEPNDFLPKRLKFYTTEEIEKIRFEDKIEKYIKLFEILKNNFYQKFENHLILKNMLNKQF